MLLALAAAAAAGAASAAPSTTVKIPERPALERAISARDAEFFALLFEGCDPARLRTMLAPGFEMYHDKGGVVTRSAEPFVAQYARDCAERMKPDAWRSRRELLRETLLVDPVPGYGAIEHGEHVFYERKGDGPEKKVGRSVFTQLWELGPDGWRLTRVFSFAHKPVQ